MQTMMVLRLNITKIITSELNHANYYGNKYLKGIQVLIGHDSNINKANNHT